MAKHHKKTHKHSHYHIGLPPREDKRYKKNFISKHLKGVTQEETENLQELGLADVANPVGAIGRAGATVAGRLQARQRNDRSRAEKSSERTSSAVKTGLAGAALGSAAGLPGAAIGGAAGAVGGYLGARSDQAKDKMKAKEPLLSTEEIELVGAAIDRISADANQDEAREFIAQALGNKILTNLEYRKAELAQAIFGTHQGNDE